MLGPLAYLQHLMSTPRLPFTAAYFGSIALTLYFSLGVSCCPKPPFQCPHGTNACHLQLHSTVLTLFSSIVQIACLLWYLVSYFPMGSSGLRLATTFGTRRAVAWMTG